MSIGGNFKESFQKGLRSLENGLNGLNNLKRDIEKIWTKKELKNLLSHNVPERFLLVGEVLRNNFSVEEICSITKYDPYKKINEY